MKWKVRPHNQTASLILQGSLITVGWISRKHLASGRGRTFFLTSLLIELIDAQWPVPINADHPPPASHSLYNDPVTSFAKHLASADFPTRCGRFRIHGFRLESNA